MSFPHRLKYGGNYKTCILPIVQKTAGKKKRSQFSKNCYFLAFLEFAKKLNPSLFSFEVYKKLNPCFLHFTKELQ